MDQRWDKKIKGAEISGNGKVPRSQINVKPLGLYRRAPAGASPAVKCRKMGASWTIL
jgi:hypothetical protein